MKAPGRRPDPTSGAGVNKPPKQLPSYMSGEFFLVAIKVFKIKDREKPCIGPIYLLKHHPVDVQNPVLVEALKPIFREKIGFRLDTEYTLKFTETFQDLWFYQEEIANLAMTAEKADALKPYLQLPLSIMNEIFAGLRFANKKTQQIALGRLQKRIDAVSAKLSSVQLRTKRQYCRISQVPLHKRPVRVQGSKH